MRTIIDKIRATKILVIGDMMLDLYLRGKASRISPEAPVPVVLAEEENKVPGGAGNVVVNLCNLGSQVTAAGFIGTDEEGDYLISSLERMRVNTEAMVRCSLPTIHKTRVLANGQHVVRFDFDSDFRNLPESEIDNFLRLASTLAIRHFDAVIISDYCKGTITPSLMEAVKKCFSCPIICDTKPQNRDLFYDAFCITPNIQEARQMLNNPIMEPLELAMELKKELRLQSIVITMAEEGILCIDQENVIISYPAHVRDHDPRHRFDVTGAGDTVTSVFTACLAAGQSIKNAVLAANVAAGVVVRKVGTASCTLDELVAELDNEGIIA